MFRELLLQGLIRLATKDDRAREAEEKRRKAHTCEFDDGISWIKFAEFANLAGTIIARVESVSVEGTIVYGTAYSQSGKSEWNFQIDFNDYGHLTGNYWIYSENRDSNVPNRLAKMIRAMIEDPTKESVFKKAYKNNHISEEDYYDDDAEVYNPISSNTQRLIDRVNHKRPQLKAKTIFILSMIACFLLAVGTLIFNYKHTVYLRISSQSAVGSDYEKIVEELHKEGFLFVSAYPESDLSIKDVSQERTIKSITIKGQTGFDAGLKLHDYTRISIIYHTLAEIKPPITSMEAQKQDYLQIKQQFVDSGFVNVQTTPIYDLITGWITKDGSVKEISIDGSTEYKDYYDYRPDVKVVISYHTFKPDDVHE